MNLFMCNWSRLQKCVCFDIDQVWNLIIDCGSVITASFKKLWQSIVKLLV